MAREPALQVSANHRRAISSTLRLLDRVVCDFDELARGRRREGMMFREENDLSSAQRGELASSVSRLRRIMDQMRRRLDLEPEAVSARTETRAQCAGLWEVLIETSSRYLRGYGQVPPELARYVDARIDGLITELHEIRRLTSSAETA